MTEDEFWDTTPRAFFNAVEGHTQERQMVLEVMRLQALCQVNTWIKKPITDPKKLWKYPWDIEKKEKVDIEKQRKRAERVKEKMERIEKRGNIKDYE